MSSINPKKIYSLNGKSHLSVSARVWSKYLTLSVFRPPLYYAWATVIAARAHVKKFYLAK